MKCPGSSIERSTCDSAAKLTIASQPSSAVAHGVVVGDVALDELEPPAVDQVLEGLDAARRR